MTASSFQDIPAREQLLSLDYLIFSSHKTGTQTLNRTLNLNGFRSRHCHDLTHLQLPHTDLKPFASRFARKNGRPLHILSVFREPVERYISSFFQEHGTRPLRLNQIRHEHETILHQYPLERLRHTFQEALESRSIICYEDSLHDICRQLAVPATSLAFDPRAPYTPNPLGSIHLHLMRFDLLFAHPETALSALTQQPVTLHPANIADRKWYRGIYTAFKTSLTLPPALIHRLYASKQDLLRLFYPGREQKLLDQTLKRYAATHV